MLDRIRKYLKLKKMLNKEQKFVSRYPEYVEKDAVVFKKIDENYEFLKNIFKESNDIIFRVFKINNKDNIKALICSIDGLSDKNIVREDVIKALTVDFESYNPRKITDGLFAFIKETALSVYNLKEMNLFNDVIDSVLSGDTCFFMDGCAAALSIDTKKWKTRQIEEPDTETVIRGPREGFTENLQDNTSLLRRKIKNPNLVFKNIVLGKQTNTNVSICYIDGIANKNIIEEVKKRLKRIDTDSILESGYIEQFIEDRPFSIFPTIGNSEKPDAVAAKILEGRVAILCDGTPFALIVPRLFIENLQLAEDYYSRIHIVNFLRLLRLISLYICILIPGIYVALQTFHQEMIPSVLLVTMAASHEGIPFPAMVEMLLLQSIFEILRESGVRLPRAIGQAVSIVGALVIGESAVRAGIISAPAVIVVAITGITSFIVTPLYEFVFIARYFMIILGGSLGLFGITAGILAICAYLSSITSFGVPFLAPFAPFVWKDMKDSIFRVPLWAKKTRPLAFDSPNKKKQGGSDIKGVKKKKTEGKNK